MLVGLTDILPEAANSGYAIAGFNIFSIDWARAVIRAAEQSKSPVIVMVNKAMITHMPPAYCGPILSKYAKEARVPVCVHLDHNTNYDIIESAMAHGFSSVMYDGSHMPLQDNIYHSAEVCKMAGKYGVSVEGELGTVRYMDSLETTTAYTKSEDVAAFVEKTKIDALAISIGTSHRSTSKSKDIIQYDLLEKIQNIASIPLVIHGTSGIRDEDIQKLKRYRIAKFNIGTLLRMAFTKSLRNTLDRNKNIFDGLEIMNTSYKAVEQEAYKMLQVLK